MNQTKKSALNSYRTLLGVAYAFAIVSTVSTAILLIPMAWTIPMTININKKRKGSTPKNCLTIGIWSLFVLNIVSGVLLIIADGKANQYLEG